MKFPARHAGSVENEVFVKPAKVREISIERTEETKIYFFLF